MKKGLLWFDDDPLRTLKKKVGRAATHYERKHGSVPNLCLVHPDAFNGHEPPLYAGAVKVRPDHAILPHHFWLGVSDGD